jgi:hypothetical protein
MGNKPRGMRPTRESRAVSPLEARLRSESEMPVMGSPFTAEFPNAKAKTRRDDTQTY